MPCFHPWKPDAALGFPPTLRLPCGQCTGCRLKRSAEWATRCMHEAKTHTHNCWLTLTYDDEHLPRKYWTGLTDKHGKRLYSGSLDKSDVQRFVRSLRKALGRKHIPSELLYDTQPPRGNADMGFHPIPRPNLRYYYGGEYGETRTRRPHYHLCLFGIQFADAKHLLDTDAGFRLYESPILKTYWPHGQHRLSELTWETAAYTARYVMKKITGDTKKQVKNYTKINHETGELITIEPEFNDMSRRPGVANQWYERYKNDVYKATESYVRVRGHKMQPPRYYDKLLQRNIPEKYEQLKKQRRTAAQLHRRNYTEPRLRAEEIITEAKIKSLKQKL